MYTFLCGHMLSFLFNKYLDAHRETAKLVSEVVVTFYIPTSKV